MSNLSQSTSFRKHTAHFVLVLLMLLGAVASLAWAQPSGGQEQASFTVNSLALAPGEALNISGRGFQAGETLLIALTSPQGNVQLNQEQAAPDGTFTFQTRLMAPGTWKLEVQRGGMRKALALEVKAGATATPPQAESFGQAAAPRQAQAAPGVSGGAGPLSGSPASGGSVAQPAQPPATISVSLSGGVLIATQDGRPLWRLGFPSGSGPTGDLLETSDGLYLAHGNSILHLDKASGVVLRRWLVSGPVSELTSSGNAITITVTPQGGSSERYTLTDGQLQPTVRFSAAPEVFGWLRQEAAVSDPLTRLKQDPTNPYLALAVGTRQLPSDPAVAKSYFQQAVASAQTFYDLAALAQTLYASGQPDLATRAFDLAMKDFAARGYTPALLTDPTLEKAYNFPLEPLQAALNKQDVAAAGFWATRLRLAAPNVPGARQALSDYADLLSQQGQKEQAKTWRARAAGESRPSVAASANSLLGNLSRSGWYAALALLIAIVALYCTLMFKYWIPQSQGPRTFQQRRNGAAAGHLLAIRCFSFTEKLVLAAMFVAVFALGALATWGAGAAPLPAALGSGTLDNAAAREYLASATLSGPAGSFIRGYADQVTGDSTAAAQAYQQAGDYAPALNNLGALEGDKGDYQRALQLSPGLLEAKYNLGQSLPAGTLSFHQTYLPDQPALVAPSLENVHAALWGTWNGALSRAFSNPWGTFRQHWPTGLSLVLWTIIQVLFLLAAIIAILWLLVPRPRRVKNQPRTVIYHLLALLFPGSGEADEVWGLLLIIPWALVGLDTVSKLLGWRSPLNLTMAQDITLLIIVYLINTIAFIVELDSYSRRMRGRQEREARSRVVGTHS